MSVPLRVESRKRERTFRVSMQTLNFVRGNEGNPEMNSQNILVLIERVYHR